ncbi:hypothetical protein SB461_23175 [Burkholderia cenocepacia]|uniref:hypothetical protein n=1 Tax=Burkholderia cenocepacia TaxID=95486 RepID=UPI002B2561ED|nr:hypothetical protein [Burkholderia cenocepacia]MEB2609397.1 hypothetical protein [Burkholderia cenocepacia]
MHVARPRPAAERGYALVVDVDDDHVGRQRQAAQHQQPVVDQPVDTRRQAAERAHENHRDPEAADRDPFDQEAAAEVPPRRNGVGFHAPRISATT